MHLLHSLWIFVAHFNIHVSAVHISGVTNYTADCISRDNMLLFFSLNSQVQLLPTPLPQPLLDIVSLSGPDWTSLHFIELFITTSYVQGLTPDTDKTYLVGQCCYRSFFQLHKMPPLPATKSSLLLFIASLANE